MGALLHGVSMSSFLLSGRYLVEHENEHADPPVRTQAVASTRTQRIAAAAVLAMCVVMSGGALVSSYLQNTSFEHAQTVQNNDRAAQGRAEEAKLCSILQPLAALHAPTGSAVNNPSRAYEQELEAKLSGLAPAIGCKP